MVFEYILKKNGIDPQTDLNINQGIDFGSTAAAFSEGSGDFTVEFEPSATALEMEGKGYVVASLGTDSGYVPYTAYSAKKSYLDKHPEIIQSFTNALQKGMDFVQIHTPEEIASVIAPQFPETDLKTITAIVNRYYTQDTWKADLIFEKRVSSCFRIFWKVPENWIHALLMKNLLQLNLPKSYGINHFLQKKTHSTIIKRKPDFWLPFFKNAITKQITFFERTLYYYD